MALRRSILALVLAAVIVPPALAQGQNHQHDGDRFQQMQHMMDRADKTTDPTKRRKLMHEHMEAMHKQMQAMHGMMGAPEGNTMQERMQNMHQRMDMMQMMMEQMMSQHRMMMMMDMPEEEPEKDGGSGNE